MPTTPPGQPSPPPARRIGQSRYSEMLDYLNGRPAPALLGLPGRVIRAYDEPLPDDLLPFIQTAAELSLILGIGRHRANRLIQQRVETAQTTEGKAP